MRDEDRTGRDLVIRAGIPRRRRLLVCMFTLDYLFVWLYVRLDACDAVHSGWTRAFPPLGRMLVLVLRYSHGPDAPPARVGRSVRGSVRSLILISRLSWCFVDCLFVCLCSMTPGSAVMWLLSVYLGPGYQNTSCMLAHDHGRDTIRH